MSHKKLTDIDLDTLCLLCKSINNNILTFPNDTIYPFNYKALTYILDCRINKTKLIFKLVNKSGMCVLETKFKISADQILFLKLKLL